MNLKKSPWDSVIWLVKLGEHNDRIYLKWEDRELGTDARVRKWLLSKPKVSYLALLQRLVNEHIFVLSHFHLNCAHAPNIYMHNELIPWPINSVWDFPRHGLNPITFSSVTLRHSLEYFSTRCICQKHLGNLKKCKCLGSHTTTTELDSPGRNP